MKKKSILITLVLIISVFAFSLVQHFQQKAYNHVNNKEISTQKEESSNVVQEPSAESKTINNNNNKRTDNTSTLKDNKNTKENPDIKHNNTNENTSKEDETKSGTGSSSKGDIKQSNSSVNSSAKEPKASSSNKNNPKPKPEPKPEVKEANIIIRNEVTGETIASIYIEIEGLNAGDATMKALSENGIACRTVRSSAGIYFSSIGGVKEKSAGPLSGWCYYVNGNKPGMGASAYTLKKSDKVEWRFLENGL